MHARRHREPSPMFINKVGSKWDAPFHIRKKGTTRTIRAVRYDGRNLSYSAYNT